MNKNKKNINTYVYKLWLFLTNYLYYNCLKSKSEDDKINKAKFKLFCETRWTEKHETLQDFDDMYEPL